MFQGIRAAFLIDIGGRGDYQQSEELMDEFREHGGRALNLSKCKYIKNIDFPNNLSIFGSINLPYLVTSRNYRDALRFVDYLVVSEDKLTPQSLN